MDDRHKCGLSESSVQNFKFSTKVLYGPGGTPLKVKGKFMATLSKNNKIIEEEVYVVDGLRTPLLSGLAAIALQLVARLDNLSLDSKETV